LRPEALDDLGLRNALRALVASVARDARLDVTPEIEADLPLLAAEQELVVYRVAQEALTNEVRHADADTLRVALCGSRCSRGVSGSAGASPRAR
jgi:two-component system sensor histidine kinase UhpB